jgi:AAA+ superfamily predicted ATPase
MAEQNQHHGTVFGRRAAALLDRLADTLDSLDGVPTPEASSGPGEFLRALAHSPATTGLPDGPIDRLALGFGLTGDDVDLVTLAVLPEHHEGVAALVRAVHPQQEPWVSAGLVAQLLAKDPMDRRATRALLETGAAARAGLATVTGERPLWGQSVKAPVGLISALTGDLRLTSPFELVPAQLTHPGLGSWLEFPTVRGALTAISQSRVVTVLVTADDESTALARAVALLQTAGVPGIVIRPTVADDDNAGHLVSMHAVLCDAVPVVVLPMTSSADGPPPAAPPSVALHRHPGPVVICARPGRFVAADDRPLIALEIAPLDSASHRAMWADLVPEIGEHAALLAARHPVEPPVAAAAAGDARFSTTLLPDRENNSQHLSPASLSAAVRSRARQLLPPGARLVHPQACWDDLVLAEDRITQLVQAVERLVQQDRVLGDWGFLAGRPGSRGVRMLFAGPSGTGKTLSAEVVASSLDVDLLVIDLSRVVSKWIGETEKNLAGIFEAAEQAQAVLFFDEADALFGERTEIKDANDRYANLETAFLLTRLEAFQGMAVLATNLRSHIDPAFTRRLEFIVEYSEPDVEQRRRLWRRHLPPTAPLGVTVDTDTLAELYPIVGALIRNATVAAAYLAAADTGVIEQRHLVHCVQREYQKAGRPFPGAPYGTIPEENRWQRSPT